MKNQEVIKYAYALTGNQQALLEFVYELLSKYILKQTNLSKYMFDFEVSFLKSLMEDASNSSSIDPLHNQYLNYITRGDIKILIPSKLYIFGPATCKEKEVKYIPGDVQVTSAECVMKLGCYDLGQYATEVLKILQYIIEKTHQQVTIAHLDWKHVRLSNELTIRKLAIQTLKISQNLTSICMWTCKLPSPIYHHLVSQLQYCENLKRLDLSECQSVDIGKAIAASTSLSDVYLYDSVLSPEAYRSIAIELQKHKYVQRLHLNRTKDIPAEMANAIKEMKSLQVFRAGDCNIREKLPEPLLKSLANCKELKEIQLGMNELTGCMMHLFPAQTDDGFPLLTRLWIKGVYLIRQDVIVLCEALYANKLPQLEHLDLSMNYKIAGTLGILLNGPNHPGFPFMKYLDLLKIQLTGEDLLSIAEAVRDGRMPKLQRLKLDKNNLSAVENEVRVLVQNCVKSYKKLHVLVQVFDTNLSETFINELQSLCEDSVVLVKNVRMRGMTF